ncbi:MAG TPA: dTMP kinase [Ktedonobacteraceae bacterium]|nr:dTMP kinase [Ktedonobacteraceae bacterium]
MEKGRLISFEGLDGAGKSTQMTMLARWLDTQHVPFIQTREPGGTSLGNEIRQLLLNRPELAIVPLAEAFLFQADRAQHFATLVIPALQEGKLVLTDRCFDASIAYQGFARGLDIALIENLSLLATQGYKPDLTILLDLDPSQVQKRTGYVQQLLLPNIDKTSNQIDVHKRANRLDTEAQSFHHRVREGFLAQARANRGRIKKVDASAPVKEVHEQIINYIRPLLNEHPQHLLSSKNSGYTQPEEEEISCQKDLYAGM